MVVRYEKLLLTVFLFSILGVSSFYGQGRLGGNVKIFTKKSKRDLAPVRSFFTSADTLISRILPKKRCADISYSVVLIDKKEFKKVEILSKDNNALRVYLSDDITAWQNKNEIFSNIIASAILKKSAVSAGENFEVIPKWMTHGILRKIARRSQRSSIPGTIAYPGIHALVLSGADIDWLGLISSSSFPKDKNAYEIYMEASEIILDSILRLPDGKNLILDIIELSNKSIVSVDIFKSVITKKLYEMKSRMDYKIPGKENKTPLLNWLNYNFKISSVNTFTPSTATDAEKLFLKSELVSYYAKTSDEKNAAPEERFCKIEELPDKLDEIIDLNSVILNKQRDLVRVAFGIPIPLQSSVYSMQRSMDLLLRDQKDQKNIFLKKYTTAKKMFFNKLEMQNQLEQYMLSVEKEFVPPGYRFYGEITAMKDMDAIKRKRWPELTELMDKCE